jgi:ABC-type nitrate/sulfonate/bicarbonate transport system substrate-binding protein
LKICDAWRRYWPRRGKDRDAADAWADRMLEVAENASAKLIVAVSEMAQAHPTLSQAFVAEFLAALQDKYPR